MDVLTKEECQAIIDADHDWESIDLTRKSGSHLKFNTADYTVWQKQYPNILKECVIRYEVGDYCSKHIDSTWKNINPGFHAHVVWITPLNDGYEGGELYVDGELVEQEVGVPLKYLRKIPHEITEVTKGTRYSLVSWLFIPNKPER